jgi:hypothetical protein
VARNILRSHPENFFYPSGRNSLVTFLFVALYRYNHKYDCMERTPSEIANLLLRAAVFKNLTPEELQYLENWGERSPGHRKLLEQAADPGWLKGGYIEVNGHYP